MSAVRESAFLAEFLSFFKNATQVLFQQQLIGIDLPLGNLYN